MPHLFPVCRSTSDADPLELRMTTKLVRTLLFRRASPFREDANFGFLCFDQKQRFALLRSIAKVAIGKNDIFDRLMATPDLLDRIDAAIQDPDAFSAARDEASNVSDEFTDFRLALSDRSDAFAERRNAVSAFSDRSSNSVSPAAAGADAAACNSAACPFSSSLPWWSCTFDDFSWAGLHLAQSTPSAPNPSIQGPIYT
ncbi:hypothetical protein DIPPA_20190 [Diplonema papillatum]|nr:hypothetical protein DIPPA_00150 [Diplonema papillatum]KAJ9440122.1 hypothetical protein DIPPA_20190 [Diplonema papillatum]